MFVGSIPSTHNKTVSGFSFCLLFFLSSPQNKSLQHGLLGAGHEESSVWASGRQRMWLAGSRAEHTGSWLTKGDDMAPPQPGSLSQLGCRKITPQTKWLKQQTFISHSSGG